MLMVGAPMVTVEAEVVVLEVLALDIKATAPPAAPAARTATMIHFLPLLWLGRVDAPDFASAVVIDT